MFAKFIAVEEIGEITYMLYFQAIIFSPFSFLQTNASLFANMFAKFCKHFRLL